MEVGFIGLGKMGNPMAHNVLRAGHSLVVYDISRTAAQPLLRAGAEWAEAPRQVAQRCEVICTSLPGPREMEAVILGNDGIKEGAQPGTVYVDLSTNSPTVVRRVHDSLAEKGMQMLDVPVSGGISGARAGTLALMVGGNEEAFERAKPVLNAIGDKIVRSGPIGSGSLFKLVSSCMAYSCSLAMVEAFTLAIKLGADPKALWETIRRSAIGLGFDLHVGMPTTLFRGDFEPQFALKLAFEKLGMALDLARESNVPMRLAAIVHQDMQEAMNRGWRERDCRISLTLQEERAGVQMRIPGLDVDKLRPTALQG